MCVKKLKSCKEFIAGDGSVLRELLHPEKADLKITYSLAHATVESGKKTKPHKLKSCEVYYIISGSGLMHIDDKFYEVKSDCTVYIKPGALQYIENTGREQLKFLCIVAPPWKEKDEQILK
jgi:mannose-6-phosphate isomerase-like protein (cupin superfamily)